MSIGAFAVIHSYPELKNAELEVIHRIVKAAGSIDLDTVLIDSGGIVLWSTRPSKFLMGSLLEGTKVEFVLCLHFTSPKVIDAYSYYAAWQPVDFYHAFGYQKSIDSLATHNDVLSCDSDIADAHLSNIWRGLNHTIPGDPLKLYHSLPEPFLEPHVSDESRLFYIGVNWERLSQAKGRFHDLLTALDEAGQSDIYGPSLVHGVAPWGGYKTYRGELPFDGSSIKHAINRAGICLALSSASHKKTGIMSNRLFEGFAGGAAVIATPNPFIDKHFKGIVYEVDDAGGEIRLTAQIREAVDHIRRHPDEARERVLEGQRILREKCSLEGSLLRLHTSTPARRSAYLDSNVSAATVTTVLIYPNLSLEKYLKCVDMLAMQDRVSVSLEVVCDEQFYNEHRAVIDDYVAGAVTSVRVSTVRLRAGADTFEGPDVSRAATGPVILSVLRACQSQYFQIMNVGDILFSDHLGSLAKAIEHTADATFACSGLLSQSNDVEPVRSLVESKFSDLTSVLLVKSHGHAGRFLFARSLIDKATEPLFSLLDGEEHSFFRLAAMLEGSLAQTGLATYVDELAQSTILPEPADLLEHQRQAIRDRYAGDPRWQQRVQTGAGIPEFVYAYAPGSPIRWENFDAPIASSRALPLNEVMPTAAEKPAMHYLTSGFSVGEEHHVWIEGDRGMIVFSADLSGTLEPSLLLRMAGRTSMVDGKRQGCTIIINGKMVLYQVLTEAIADVRVPVPFHLVQAATAFRVEIVPDHAEFVHGEDGKVSDKRRLSIMLTGLGILTNTASTYPRIEPGQMHPTVAKATGAKYLSSGFYQPESNLTWMVGTEGFLSFGLSATLDRPSIRLVLAAKALNPIYGPQTVRIAVNGVLTGPYTISEAPMAIDIPLPATGGGLDVDLTLTAAHAEPIVGETGATVDGRMLGVCILGLGVFDAGDAKFASMGGPIRRLISRLASIRSPRELG